MSLSPHLGVWGSKQRTSLKSPSWGLGGQNRNCVLKPHVGGLGVIIELVFKSKNTTNHAITSY